MIITARDYGDVETVRQMHDPRPLDTRLVETAGGTVDQLDRSHSGGPGPSRRNNLVQSTGERLDDDRLAAGEQARKRKSPFVDVAQIRGRDSLVDAIGAENVDVLSTPADLQRLQQHRALPRFRGVVGDSALRALYGAMIGDVCDVESGRSVPRADVRRFPAWSPIMRELRVLMKVRNEKHVRGLGDECRHRTRRYGCGGVNGDDKEQGEPGISHFAHDA